MNAERRSKRVSKDQWLATALEELERGGIEAVRVERLATILRVSKSGFYWHFKGRQDLHRHLLDYWIHEYTEIVTSNPLLFQGDPRARLEKVSTMITQHDLAKYDLAIRAWAKHDELAHQAVERVTKVRLGFLRGIFSDMGFTGDNLEIRTMTFVSYHTWESATYGHMSPRTRSRRRKRLLDLLSG